MQKEDQLEKQLAELLQEKEKIEEQRNGLVKERDELKVWLNKADVQKNSLEKQIEALYTGNKSLEEEINFLKYRIQTLDELHESVVWGEWPHDGSMQRWKCLNPFERFEILPRGEVYTCCSGYLKHHYYIGNIFEDSFEHIWNSDRAKKLRYSVSRGNFEYCQKICRWFHQKGEILMDGAARNPLVKRPENNDFSEGGWTECEVLASPKQVILSCDESCNLSCPTCRSAVRGLDKGQAEKLYQKLEQILPLLLKDCELLGGLSSGEIFASHAISRLYKTITADRYPKLTLSIITNLQLLTKEKWFEFENLHDIPIRLHVSVDAAEKETYEINRRGGTWERLRENLLYFREWRRKPDNKIEFLEMSFVVQKNNYHQIKDFIQFAEEMEADVAEFQKMTNWGTFSEEEFRERNVLDPKHPKYQEACDILDEVSGYQGKVRVMQNLI